MAREQFLILLTVEKKAGETPELQAQRIETRLEQAIGSGRRHQIHVEHFNPDDVGKLTSTLMGFLTRSLSDTTPEQ